MQNLADTVRPFIGEISDKDQREDAAEALEFLCEIDIALVAAEKANKGVPKLRKASRAGLASVIANRGKIKSLNDADIMMSMAQLVEIVGCVYDGAGKKMAKRRPAGAVLAQLEPTHPSILNMRITPRTHEETHGGRRRLG